LLACSLVVLSGRYYLKDVIVGKIYFLLVRIKIKHMELAVIRKETAGSGSNVFSENETITKYEIMDGAPVRGTCSDVGVLLPVCLSASSRGDLQANLCRSGCSWAALI
jgi:hypothetical protein